MAASQTLHPIGSALTKPLRGWPLVAAAVIVWLAGAAYCHGYERLLTGADEWAGSLLWSALAVIPWFALFELSKSEGGRRIGSDPLLLALALAAVAALSLMLELGWHTYRGNAGSPLALMMMRRLPAIGASLLLILWASGVHRRTAQGAEPDDSAANLAELAASIDWIAAADNYVELHVGGRVLLRRMTMQDAERQLAKCGFVRIHRRFLINAGKLEAVLGSKGDRRVRIAGAELPVGSRYASRLTC